MFTTKWTDKADGLYLCVFGSKSSKSKKFWGPDAKKYLSQQFFGPPFRLQKKKKKKLKWKLQVNPIEKNVNSIFNGKSMVIFSGAPLTRVKNFKGPPFCIRSLLQVFVNGP